MGTVARIVVPLPGEVRTVRLPPTSSALSRIPARPTWPSVSNSGSGNSNPHPSSRSPRWAPRPPIW